MKKIVECVPNFSEGKDRKKIDLIIEEIHSVRGVYVLHTDMGLAANRTVITFAGEPFSVVEAAFRAIRKATELIDMRVQKGVHPRIGATDVCPLVPVSGITMEETVNLAHRLAGRVGEELQIPVYCYEKSALIEARKNLANVRAGQYEGLPLKLADPAGKPDYGPAVFVPRTGAIAIGARNFLIAYNIDLETKFVGIANEIANIIREKGPVKRNSKGDILYNNNGAPVFMNNGLKSIKAIGWYVEEYGNAQVSVNVTDFMVTPLHVVYERVKDLAAERNIRLLGSEIIGLVPYNALELSGRYYAEIEGLSVENQYIEMAVKCLGLSNTRPFISEQKILEYLLTGDK